MAKKKRTRSKIFDVSGHYQTYHVKLKSGKKVKKRKWKKGYKYKKEIPITTFTQAKKAFSSISTKRQNIDKKRKSKRTYKRTEIPRSYIRKSGTSGVDVQGIDTPSAYKVISKKKPIKKKVTPKKKFVKKKPVKKKIPTKSKPKAKPKMKVSKKTLERIVAQRKAQAKKADKDFKSLSKLTKKGSLTKEEQRELLTLKRQYGIFRLKT